MTDHVTQIALEAYRQDAALIEIACREALGDNIGVLVTKRGARVYSAEASERVPAGQIRTHHWDDVAQVVRREDTQINERHLRPLPLEQQVPGAWNFEGPPPRRHPMAGVDDYDTGHGRRGSRTDYIGPGTGIQSQYER